MKRILAIVVALCVIQEPLPAFASRVFPSRPSALQESFIQNRFEQDAIVYRALWMCRLIDPLARPLVRKLRTWRRRRLAGAIERLGWAPSVSPATGGMHSLFRVRDAIPETPVDVIVAIGCGLRPDGLPSLNSVDVAKQARKLLNQGRAPLILLSGGYRENGISEEEAMSAVLRAEGVDPGKIILTNAPDVPSSTHLQPAAVATILQQHYSGVGRPRVLLVGHPVHLPRALWLFRRALPDVDFYSVNAPEAYDVKAAQIRLYNAFFFQIWNLLVWMHHRLFPPPVFRLSSSRGPVAWLVGPDPDIPLRPATDPDVSRSLKALETASRALFLGSANADGRAAAHETATRWMRGEIQGQSMHPKTFLAIDCRRFVEEHGTGPAGAWRELMKIPERAGGQMGVILYHAESALADPSLEPVTRSLLLDGRFPVLATSAFSGYQRLEANPREAREIPFIVTTPPARIKRRQSVLIIGASSFLGETMFHAFSDRYETVTGTAFSKPDFLRLDVTIPADVARTLQTLHPDVVVYVAGEVAADNAGVDRARTYRLNAGVVDTIADHFHGKFVYISTEYVFDGKYETGPYTSASPTAPINYYGETKVAGEDRTKARFPDGLILRVGVLYGFNHPNDKNTTAKTIMQKLRDGSRMVMDAEQIKRPISIQDVSDTLLRLLGHEAAGIYQLNGNSPVSKLAWAQIIFQILAEMAPLEPVDITSSGEPPLVPRPLNTEMVNTDTPRETIEGHRAMLRQSGLVWLLFTRAWEIAAKGDPSSRRALMTSSAGGALWSMSIPRTIEAAFHVSLKALGTEPEKRRDNALIPAMVEAVDNFRQPEMLARIVHVPHAAPGVEVLAHTPRLFDAPILWQAQSPDLSYGTSLLDTLGVIRLSGTAPDIAVAGLREITSHLPPDLAYTLMVRRVASGHFEAAVVFHNRPMTEDGLAALAARSSPVRALTDATYRSIEHGALPHQHYAYEPLQHDVVDASGLKYSLVLNQGRYEYVSRTVRAAAQALSPKTGSAQPAEKQVVVPHKAAPRFQTCEFCDTTDSVIASRVDFAGERYKLRFNKNPWGRKHVLLVTDGPVAQRLFPWHLKGTLDFLQRMGESFEVIFNGVQAAASIFHFHAQVHEGHSSIWRNLDAGRLSLKALAQGPVEVHQLTHWPARAYLIEGADSGPTAIVAARMVAQLERQNIPQNVSMRIHGGRFQIIIYDRNLQTEKPQGIDEDPNAWSRYGGIEMGGTLFLLMPEAFRRLSSDPAAGQKLRGALGQLSAGSQDAETFVREWKKAGTGLMPPAKNGVYVFDVDGTLANRNEPLSPEMIAKLTSLLQSGARVVMATGQNFDLEQQERFANIFPVKLRHLLTIYANEGATKYEFDKLGNILPDVIYNQYFQLSPEEQAIVLEEMSHVARQTGISFRRPPEIWSGAEAICKLPADPAARAHFAQVLAARLKARGLDGLRISVSGTTTVAVLRAETSKLLAIRDLVDSTPGLLLEDVVYIGDELSPGGGDEDVLRLSGLTAIAVNRDQTTVAPGARPGGPGVTSTLSWISFLQRTRRQLGSLSKAVQSFEGPAAPAEAKESHVQPSSLRDLAIAAVAGLLIGTALVVLGIHAGETLKYPITGLILGWFLGAVAFVPGLLYSFEFISVVRAKLVAKRVRSGRTRGPDPAALEVFQKNLEKTYGVQIVPRQNARHIASVDIQRYGRDVVVVDLLALSYLPSFMIAVILTHEKTHLLEGREWEAYLRGSWGWIRWIWQRWRESKMTTFEPRFVDLNDDAVLTNGLGIITLGVPPGLSKRIGHTEERRRLCLLPADFTVEGQSRVAVMSLMHWNKYGNAAQKTRIVGTPEQLARISDYMSACSVADRQGLSMLSQAQRLSLEKESAILADRRADGSPSEWSDWVELIRLSPGEAWSDNGVTITSLDVGRYRIQEGLTQKTLGDHPFQPVRPVFPVMPRVSSIPEFGVTFLGSADAVGSGLPTSFVVWAGHRGLLVDPSSYIIPLLDNIGVDLDRITDLILTHAHESHGLGLLPLLPAIHARGGRVRLFTSPIIRINMERQLKDLLGDNEASDLLTSTVEWVDVVPGETVPLGRHASMTLQFSLHDMPALMGRVRYYNRIIAFSGDHLYDPARYSEWTGGALPLAVRQDIQRIDPGSALPIEPDRRQILERFLLEGRPDLLIHDFGDPAGERGRHTSADAFRGLPPDIRGRVYGVHRPGTQSVDRSIPWAYAGLTIEIKTQAQGLLPEEWLNELREKVRSGLTPEQYNRLETPIKPVAQGAVPVLTPEVLQPESSRPRQPISVAVGISAGGLSEFPREQALPALELAVRAVDENPHSLLEWKLGAVRHAVVSGRSVGRTIPVFLLTSTLNERATRDLLTRKNNFGFSEGDIHVLAEPVVQRIIPGSDFMDRYLASRSARVRADVEEGLLQEAEAKVLLAALSQRVRRDQKRAGETALDEEGQPSVNPVGHWEFIRALVISGGLAQLHREEVDFIYHSNLTNVAATLNGNFLRLCDRFAEARRQAVDHGRPEPLLQAEMVRNEGKYTGSYLVQVGGGEAAHTELVKGSVLEASGIPPSKCAYFYTGNALLSVDGLLRFFGLDPNYDRTSSAPEIAALIDQKFLPKPEMTLAAEASRERLPDGREATVSSVAFQLERNLEGLTQAPWVAVDVTDDERYVPVRDMKDLVNAEETLGSVLAGNVDLGFSRRPMRVPADELNQICRHPLVFDDNLVSYPWGGTWITRYKGLGFMDRPIAESWEASGHHRFPSRLPLPGGRTIELPDLLSLAGSRILGRRIAKLYENQMPLLCKFLDTHLTLSIQVHPSNQVARQLGERDPGKEEVFYVVGVQEASAKLYLGLRDGVDEKTFRQAVAAGADLTELMNAVTVRPGEVYRIPPGTVHAWGGGLQVVEMAQASDITYRLYDFNRKQRARPLHPDKGLAAMNFKAPTGEELIQHLRREWEPTANSRVKYVRLDPSIGLERVLLVPGEQMKGETGADFAILMAIHGHLEIIDADGAVTRLVEGHAALLPADMGGYQLRNVGSVRAEVLRIHTIVPEAQLPVHLTVSAGGTKLKVGAADAYGLLAQGHRLPWAQALRDRGLEINPASFISVIVSETMDFLQRYNIPVERIAQVGVAWPGPVDNYRGTVSATFIPGFLDYPFAAALSAALGDMFGHPVQVHVIFDAIADLLGEIKGPRGIMRGQVNGMVLNLATGIAAGLLKDGRVIEKEIYAPAGETPLKIERGIGQLGRHLFRRQDGSWVYRPTSDGTIPPFDSRTETRWTDLNGGPALVRRYAVAALERFGPDDVGLFGRPLRDIQPSFASRNEALEMEILQSITATAQGGDSPYALFALQFIHEMATEIGNALRTFAESYPEAHYLDRVVLVGGIGEHLGIPMARSADRADDMFVKTIFETSGARFIARAKQGVERELLASMPPKSLKELVVPLQNGVTWETYQRFLDEMAALSLDSEPEILTMHMLTPDGQQRHYTVMLPREIFTVYPDYLATALALHVNVQGEMTGLRTVWLTTTFGTATRDLLNRLETEVKTQFSSTIARANYGAPIQWLEEGPAKEPTQIAPKHFPAVPFAQGCAVGVDMGGPVVKIALLRDGRIVARRLLSQHDVGGPALGDAMEKAIESVWMGTGLPASDLWSSPLLIGVPGSVDPSGFIAALPNLETAHPGSKTSLEAFRLRHPNVEFINDANMAGEFYVRTSQLRGTVVLNTLGTGLGIAIIQDGQLMSGIAESHIRIDLSQRAPIHSCGNQGCLEDQANAAFVARRAKELAELRGLPDEGLEHLKARDVIDWLNGDLRHQDVAKQVLREMGGNIGILQAIISDLLQVKELTVILAGGIAQPGARELVMDGIQQKLAILRSDVRISGFIPAVFPESNEFELTATPPSWIGASAAALLSLSARSRPDAHQHTEERQMPFFMAAPATFSSKVSASLGLTFHGFLAGNFGAFAASLVAVLVVTPGAMNTVVVTIKFLASKVIPSLRRKSIHRLPHFLIDRIREAV